MGGVLFGFESLGHRFGRRAVLAGVSATIEDGGLLQVVGVNGSGKSTLLRCLAGLLRPSSGTITHREDRVSLDPVQRRNRVGYVAPDVEGYDALTTAEHLGFFATLRRAGPERAAATLRDLDLPGGVTWRALSSGQRQRLRWALALLGEPLVLLLDEPFEHLDAGGRTLVKQVLARHRANGGLAIVAGPEPVDLPGFATLRLEIPPSQAGAPR